MMTSFLALQDPSNYKISPTLMLRCILLVFDGPELLKGCEINHELFNETIGYTRLAKYAQDLDRKLEPSKRHPHGSLVEAAL